MANLADLKFVHSGGAANTDPDLDLGGAISTAGAKDILSQTGTGLTTITGVTINDAVGNNEGSGTLFYDNNADTLRWTPFNGTAGTPVDVSSNGAYAIQGGGSGAGLLKITVVAGSLPSSNQTNSVTIVNIANGIFDDVSKADAQAGDTEYRGIFLQNDHASDSMVDIKLWIAQNTPGQDGISIALADEAKNLAIETIADENTAPVGPDFDATNPIDAASGLAPPDLLFSDYTGLWIRRTVPSGTNQSQTNNTFRLGVRIFV